MINDASDPVDKLTLRDSSLAPAGGEPGDLFLLRVSTFDGVNLVELE